MVDMVKKPHELQRKATQDTTSGQNPRMTFGRKLKDAANRTADRIKKTAKIAFKPIAITAMGAALYFTLNTSDAKAQEYTYASGDPKNKSESMTDGVKIYGTKTFNVKYEKGTLYFDSVKVGNEGYASFEVKVNNAEAMKISELTNKDVKSIYYTNYYTNQEGIGNIAYLVFEHGILGALPQATTKKGGAGFAFVGSSKDKLYLDAIFTAPNGSILATTPSTLLVITPDGTMVAEYKKIGGEKTPDLTSPKFSQGSTLDLVDLRDPTFNDGKIVVKLQIDTKKIGFTVVEDKMPIGGGN